MTTTHAEVIALRAARDERTRKRDIALERIGALEAQFDWLERQVFGETSERIVELDPSLQSPLFTDLPDAHVDDPVLVPEPMAEPMSPPCRKKRPPGTGESGLRADATVPREILELGIVVGGGEARDLAACRPAALHPSSWSDRPLGSRCVRPTSGIAHGQYDPRDRRYRIHRR